MDFPFPIDDWAGRGFTPDPERFAGDLVVDAVRDQQAALRNPPVPMPALMALFERLGLTETTAELRRLNPD